MAVKICTRFDPPVARSTCAGSPVRKKYVKKVNEDFTEVLIETGETNLHDYINSFADGVSLEMMLRRFQLGDRTALQNAEGVYMDASGMPRDLASAYRMIGKAEAIYANLPENIRKDFPSSKEFLQAFSDSGTFKGFCEKYLKRKQPAPKVEPNQKGGDQA